MMTPQRRVVFDFEAPVRRRITQNPDLFDFALTPPSKIKHNLPLVALSSEPGQLLAGTRRAQERPKIAKVEKFGNAIPKFDLLEAP